MAGIKLFSEYLVIPFLFLFLSTLFVVTSLNVSTLCIKEERLTLLKIKKNLKDASNCLSSWVGEDCCYWKGIECDNQTGHVLKLHLRYSQICSTTNKLPLGGKISPSLTDLKHLSHLDLSDNDFEGITIPKFIGSLNMLRYLDLSNANFAGMVPTHLGNLSNLLYLDISIAFSSLWIIDVSWLSALSSLQYLHMGSVNISSASYEFFRALSMMPSLVELQLPNCKLVTLPPSLPFENFTSLSVLDLSGNYFNSSTPSWLFNMSNLIDIDLTFSSLRGPLPVLGRGNLCKLQRLLLSNNDLIGDITQMLETLSSCSNQSLKLLELNSNHLTGKLLHSVGNLSNLVYLDLEGNMMNGKIPKSIGQLTKLQLLNLLENNWEGTMTNIHFHNLTNIVGFSVSSKTNSFIFNVTQDWIPPFKSLHYVEIRDCQVGPTFPNWLNNQVFLLKIILRNAKISGEIPRWLYSMSSQIRQLDLSHNKISGGIPASICSLPSLFILELSKNNLSVDLSFVFQNCTTLRTLSLGNNRFFGSLPNEITKNLPSLSELLFRGNRLSGSIPEELCRLPFLHLLDLAENNISGSLPTCLGDVHGFKLPQTNFAYLPHPTIFYDSLTYRRHIELTLKGRIIDYLSRMLVYSAIDLSNNHLSGEIPVELAELIHLGAMNLSWNKLTGHIPDNIGSLKDLESLDLSHNRLLGPIPPSMASMTFLSYLNLSYNNLSGQIPIANQFGTFNDPSVYAGNPYLCGDPLPIDCSSLLHGNGEEEKDGADEDDEKIERLGLYASIAVGYITAFWLVFGSLLLKRSWRNAQFKFVFDMRDKLLVLIAVNLARAKRRFGLERI
uniref:LRR receptor-like serine/threonine-protein kinase GSO2 n=1 Tax=Cajanus cajan TaxID=3821 RepID=A0A151R1C4_CAJCA|nr:LRR receptor-like serine/threonine-protein kinase GSO2 [Cajanus cajan]